jgi:hypothetical protein
MSEIKIIILSVVLALFLITHDAYSQSINNRSAIQDSLSKLSSLIWKQKTDSGRLQANSIFFQKFQSALKSESTTQPVFDSINGITRLASVDGKFRLFTWNVPLSDGTNKYFGFIQYSRDSLVVVPLHSARIEGNDFDTKQLSLPNWYGAIYYKLIEVETGGQKVYTLLGWDGYTSNSNRKIIDILYLDNAGNVVFGMPVFKTGKGLKSRVVLEYAKKSNMLLRYDYQSIMVEKGKKIKKENTWLIVMDRMVPMDPSMEGDHKYYVPAGDTYDGYIFRNGYWTLVENIEVTNNPGSIK